MQIKAIIKYPDDIGREVVIEDSLDSLRSIVGGHVEYFCSMNDLAIICNEEGKINGMPFNIRFAGEYLFGPLIFAGRDPENEESGLCDFPVDFKLYKQFILGIFDD